MTWVAHDDVDRATIRKEPTVSIDNSASSAIFWVGLDVHRDSITSAVLAPGKEIPLVDRWFHDEPSVRRFVAGLGSPGQLSGGGPGVGSPTKEVSTVPDDEVRTLVRQVAMAPSGTAAAALRRLPDELDLDMISEDDKDLLPALGGRAKELGAAHRWVPAVTGVWRHTWLTNQVALDHLVRAQPSDQRFVRGRPATLAAYAATTGDLAFHPPLTSRLWVDQPEQTMAVEFHGFPLRVPVPAQHALQTLWYGAEIDAAWAMQHAEMDWGSFQAEATRLGLRLHDLLGSSVVPASALRELTISRASRGTDMAKRGAVMLRTPLKR
jgi:hypothetical protein